MTWTEFKNQDVGQIIDTIQAWEDSSTDTEADAREFAEDVLDNLVFQFEEGSFAETLSDMAIQMGSSQYYSKLASVLAKIMTPFLRAKPLAGVSV